MTNTEKHTGAEVARVEAVIEDRDALVEILDPERFVSEHDYWTPTEREQAGLQAVLDFEEHSLTL